jgi:hypothetical protein
MENWPELPYEAWRDTLETFHMVTQIVGKLRLSLSPAEPEWGHVALYVTARGLTTSPLPHPHDVFDVDIDLVDHAIVVRTRGGAVKTVRLEAKPVARYYGELMAALTDAGVETKITELPQEVPDPIPFPQDTVHASYDPAWANRFLHVLVTVDQVMKTFRAPYRGRSSPVHFFWGSFDHAYVRFSGRPAEPPPGADAMMRVAHDAEQFACGFWPGDYRLPEAGFYAYTFPHPEGLEYVEIRPEAASWHDGLGEFFLPYEAVRTAGDPARALLDFFESTYQATAVLADWP